MEASTKYIICLLCILNSIFLENGNCQGINGKSTPQTSDFMKYGETPISLFTGKINIDIPIFEYKDGNFDIPISSVYTSDGFKPSKWSGAVGLNWFLKMGGVITREIYGSPDDLSPSVSGLDLGYWLATGERTYSKTSLWNFSSVTCSSIGCMLPVSNDGYFVDYQQDLFSFNFGGHSGQFMIDNDRSIRTNIKGYKVDFSKFSSQSSSNIIPDTSKIVITTPDGYKYTFGGTLNSLEYSINFTPENYPASGFAKPTIMSWYLTKIEAPNARYVQFNYVSENLSSTSTRFLKIWQSSKNTTSGVSSYKAIKTVIPESIIIPDKQLRIDFVKSTSTALDYGFYDGYASFNYGTYQIDSILVKINNRTIHSSSFYFTGFGKRRFLSSLKQSDGGIYRFNYYQCDLPTPETTNVDFFGYWNVNDSSCYMGQLHEVTYPTGGKSVFTYERNNYGKRVNTYVSSNLLLTSLETVLEETGGARIKKVEHISVSGQQASSKEYIYISNFSYPLSGIGSPIRSGILYQYPPFEYTTTGSKSFYSINAWSQNYNIGEPHVGYSNVVELNADNSYILYKFSDYNSNPDTYNYNLKLEPGIDAALHAATNVNKASSASASRGRLVEKIFYNSQNNRIKKETYTYRNTPKTFDNAVIAFRGIAGGGIAKQIHLQYNPLNYKGDSTSGVEEKEYYQYNSNDLLISRSLANAPSDTLKTTYKYPSDFATSGNNYQLMVNHNILDLRVEEKQYRNNSCIQTQRNTHKFPGNTIAPLIDSVKMSYGDNVPETRAIYHEYDMYFNPRYFTSDGVLKTTYLWSYSGQHVIAEIQNATFSEVTAHITLLKINTIALSAEPTGEELTTVNNLRSSLTNALITTFTYKPLVGITSVTDPRGLTTTYEYDGKNRLVSIKDPDGKIVKKMDYHYAE